MEMVFLQKMSATTIAAKLLLTSAALAFTVLTVLQQIEAILFVAKPPLEHLTLMSLLLALYVHHILSM